MTRLQRRQATIWALGFMVCLIAARRPQIVGDGGEYLTYAINFASFHGPSLDHKRLDALRHEVIAYAPELDTDDFYRNTVPGRDGRRDYMHFWFMSLCAAPFVWLARIVGLPAVYGFVAMNLSLMLLALWVALPRLGVATSLLIFASPVVWWLDKAHPEVFTFSLLTLAVLLVRDRPWWAMVAAGVASTQYPHIAALVPVIAALTIAANRQAIADRRLRLGFAAGLAIALMHPTYYYVRHGTPSLLFSATNSGVPAWADITSVLLDPVIGLVPNFPIFVVVVAVAAALVLRRRRDLFASDMLFSLALGTLSLWVCAQKDNVHHGATPSLSRYALWFIPVAMPLLRTERIKGIGWRRFVWCAALLSAIADVIVFHPSVPQNSREPTWAAEYLWTRHPAWNNPLPEVFTETYRKVEEPLAPTTTRGCEKILMAGSGTWPIPCFPTDLPVRCRPRDWCYANRTGAGYTFIRAPGSWNRGPVVDADAVWPAEAEPTVRRLYNDWQWWTLRAPDLARPPLQGARKVRADLLQGDSRLVVVLHAPQPGAVVSLRMPGPMAGVLVDARNGQTIGTPRFSGAAGDTLDVEIPTSPDLTLLMLQNDR